MDNMTPDYLVYQRSSVDEESNQGEEAAAHTPDRDEELYEEAAVRTPDRNRDEELREEAAALKDLIQRKREMVKERHNRPERVVKELRLENEMLDQVLDMTESDQDTERKTVTTEDGGGDGAAAPEPQELHTKHVVSKMLTGLLKEREPGVSEEASTGMAQALDSLLNHEAMSTLQSKVRQHQLSEQKKGVDPVIAMGTSIRETYNCGAEKIKEKYPENEAMAATLKGVMYMLITGVGINQAAAHGFVAPENVDSLVEGALSVFTRLTGFTWKLLERTVQDPGFWAGVIASFFGLILTGVGCLISGSRVAHHAAKLSC